MSLDGELSSAMAADSMSIYGPNELLVVNYITKKQGPMADRGRGRKHVD
jgi:hypothetical protein